MIRRAFSFKHTLLLPAVFTVAAVLIGSVPAAAQGEACGYCSLSCPSGEHAVWGDWQVLGGWHASCWAPGDCRYHAYGCIPGEDEQEQQDEIVQAALSKDAHALRSLLVDPPKGIHVNVERNAIQVLSCKGDLVVAQYPLGEVKLSELVEAG